MGSKQIAKVPKASARRRNRMLTIQMKGYMHTLKREDKKESERREKKETEENERNNMIWAQNA